MKCRFCGREIKETVIDLVNAPPSNAYLREEQLNDSEIYYPLKIMVCEHCWLVQVDEYASSADIFDDDYLYFSSYSSSWVEHARKYVEMIIPRLSLSSNSKVMEIASNDGYLLQFFVKSQIPCVGVEPSTSTIQEAAEKGVESIPEFFGTQLAKWIVDTRGKQNLIIGNNVLAHVPDINDFVEGLQISLARDGTITMEFPHLLNLLKYVQFDTIYHEHYSYLSLLSVQQIFSAHGLKIYDVEELPTHGGSLRIYACHKSDDKPISSSVPSVLQSEIDYGLNTLDVYVTFRKQVENIRNDFLEFLIRLKKEKKCVVGYGAAAKGNTLFNYCGIKGNQMIYAVADASPHKQGRYLPGSHIPIISPEAIKNIKPDYLIIIPWNIKQEIMNQNAYIREWGGKFVTIIPRIEISE
ncbi:class I SAM-dependent methyltransferase [Methanocorpusculum sp. MG]|uniref:Class I SAM-dependent methyltransferase n=1 Tax=Methanocorpusculum petauri TaxID=3002863 RepID=A0ABT4IGS2_9EURY|nr:class I SAM-dependent methyltransferase [Methanocorpusculum petauri]MCZ0860942.1 class I SAM-dependent methyltransferase [Methanocorpusculum petauri]